MKMVKYGKNISGETLRRILPRMELLKETMTILDIKKYIFNKVKYVYKEAENKFSTD